MPDSVPRAAGGGGGGAGTLPLAPRHAPRAVSPLSEMLTAPPPSPSLVLGGPPSHPDHRLAPPCSPTRRMGRGSRACPRLPPALAVTPSDLMYRGEGADHVVLGLRKLGRVVRLRKTSIGSGLSREELVRRAARDLEVLARVGRPVLGRLLTDAAHLVLVSPRPDSALSDTLLPWRRGDREGKEINTHGVACICPDATTIFIPRHDTTTPTPPTPAPCQKCGCGTAVPKGGEEHVHRD
ncbi:hypothetical protein O3P69_018737 [Scylla paramamosain]|uniref:Inositol-pentakisphosphate 2-kinase n=1 Tax=Scylla paramamosain TaxID=85552 RepID=A0AAW0ST95_SCYPA